MNKYRFLPFALAMLALVGFVAAQTAAEDKPGADRRADDRGDKGTTTKGMGVYSGKIVRVDSTSHTIVLGDIKGRGGKGTGAGSGTGTGAGAGAGTGSDKTATDRGDTDKGKTGNRTMTFKASDKARITLDGKEGTFSDLKAGLYARVHTDRSGSAGSGGTGGTSGTEKSGATEKSGTKTGGDAGAARDTEKGGTGGTADRVRTATRIEAFTKAPTDTGTGAGRGTGGTNRDR